MSDLSEPLLEKLDRIEATAKAGEFVESGTALMLVSRLREYWSALYACERALSAVQRCGYPLDESYPKEAIDAYEQAGDLLWPEA